MKTAAFAIVFALGATSAAAAPDQIDLLRQGYLQCYGPNSASHTCAALSGYTFGDTIVNKATVLISADPVGTMTTVSPVTIKNGAICGTAAKADIDAAVITSEGVVLGEAQAGPVKQQIWDSVAPMAGKELCTTYVPHGNAYSTKYTLDGGPDGTPSVDVILVSPKDGWHVGPP